MLTTPLACRCHHAAQVQDSERIDVGWVSVWVKTSAQWVTGLLYLWTLVAPAMFPDREFA